MLDYSLLLDLHVSVSSVSNERQRVVHTLKHFAEAQAERLDDAMTVVCQYGCIGFGIDGFSGDEMRSAAQFEARRFDAVQIECYETLTESKISVSTRHPGTPVSAYYLPWGSNRAFWMELPSSGAKLFVTAPLNDCAVFFEETQSGLRVFHANYAYMDGLREDHPARRDLFYSQLRTNLINAGVPTKTRPSARHKLFAPRDYNLYGQGTQVFGLFHDDTWTFYCHQWRNSDEAFATTRIWPNPCPPFEES